MRNIVRLLAIFGALAVVGVGTPAFAAMGQCYDSYGRPVGPPHNTDNPPYDLICSVYAQGGQCTHVQPGWAESNCGLAPRDSPGYDKGYPQYNYRPNYGPRYSPPLAPQERDRRWMERVNPGQKYVPHSDPNHPLIPEMPQNNAR
jgi:hypothetical protein